MNESIITLIADYAKATKSSKAKLMALVEQCIDVHNQDKPKAQSTGVRGRVASQEIVELREKIRNMKPELAQSAFTIKQIAEKLQAQHVEVGNAVNFLAKNEGLFIKTGYEKKSQGRGRPEAVWSVV